jgi:transcriptional regulator with XRE-family HTH domain
MGDIYGDIDDLFRELKKRGVSKGEVAEKIGITQPYLSKVLSGEKPITDSFMAGLHKFYGATIKELGLKFTKSEGDKPVKNIEQEEDIKKPDTLHIALRGNQVLYDANRDLAYANRRLADAHYMLAESNRELVMALISSGKQFGIQPKFVDPGITPEDAEGGEKMISSKRKKAG